MIVVYEKCSTPEKYADINKKKIEILSIVNGIRYQKHIKYYFKYAVTQLGRMQFEISDVLSKDMVFVQEPSLLLPHLRRWKCFFEFI